jgi:hypothetical protein
MQEFSSISVSTYEPDALTGQLNEQSAAGWDVVAIIPTGSTITAYLAREAGGSGDEPAHDDVVVVPADEADGYAVADQPAEAPIVVPAPAPDETPFTVAEPAAEPAPEPAAEPAAAAAPAGWYADPSARFELRYWDGSTWTEHVSRGGQQFTDPPLP